MLPYFPVPYEDELLYSCIARYGCHTGQAQNQKAVIRDVWGTDSAVAIPDLPSHLQDFIDNSYLLSRQERSFFQCDLRMGGKFILVWG